MNGGAASAGRITGWWWVAAQFAIVGVWGWYTATGATPPLPQLQWIPLVAGTALLAEGLALLLFSYRRLGPSFTPNPLPKPASGLATRGIYALVRHPMYGGVMLAMYGGTMIRPTVVGAATCAVITAFFLAKSRFEERHLARLYPEYPQYAATTRRFFPGVW